MESKFILNSIGIGGAFFCGIILFWFVFVYLKKRMTADQSTQGHSAAAKISWEEKRRHPRIDITWQAVLENAARTEKVALKDISLGGAFVCCQQPWALQDKFKFSLNLPDRQPLQLNAEVVWSNVNMPSDKVVNRGMGIRFINNPEQARRQLQAAIDAAMEKSDESGERNP
jgi:Tfp pilus assembly protein PilZ